MTNLIISVSIFSGGILLKSLDYLERPRASKSLL